MFLKGVIQNYYYPLTILRFDKVRSGTILRFDKVKSGSHMNTEKPVGLVTRYTHILLIIVVGVRDRLANFFIYFKCGCTSCSHIDGI